MILSWRLRRWGLIGLLVWIWGVGVLFWRLWGVGYVVGLGGAGGPVWVGFRRRWGGDGFVAVDPIIFRNFVFAFFLRDVVLAASIWKNWNWGCLVLTA